MTAISRLINVTEDGWYMPFTAFNFAIWQCDSCRYESCLSYVACSIAALLCTS